MPRLRELGAAFIRYETRVEPYDVIVGDPATWRERGCPTEMVIGPRQYLVRVPTLAEAQGITFRCPKPECQHYIDVSFADRGVLPEQGSHNEQGKPTRWHVSGSTSLDDLTTRPSILLKGGCGWHGYITNGVAA